MNNSDYINASVNYATDKKNDYENSLSYLLTGLDESKALDQEAANVRYQNLVNRIRQQIPGIQQQFERNAKAAYINKQQNLQQIDADLNRLGVNTQGFGVTQRLLNETAYGQAYGDLVINYNDAMRDIDNQEINALGDLNAQLADLDAAYAKDKLDTQKYIGEQGLNVYNNEYKNYYNDLQYQDDLKQQQWENNFKQRQYEEELRQQAWENAFKEKQYQEQLAQQQWERTMQEKELALKEKQVNAQIANSRSSSSSSSRGSGGSSGSSGSGGKIVTTNYCLSRDQFSSSTAYQIYNGILNTDIQNKGINSNYLSQYLTECKNNGQLTSKDVSAIKKQFGI